MPEKDFFAKVREKIEQDRISTPLKYVEFGVDFYKSFINSHYQIITFICVLAGFGFTAMGNVRCKMLFFFGELVLFMLASYILFSTKETAKSEALNLFEQKDKWITFYKQYDELIDRAESENYNPEKYNTELKKLYNSSFPEEKSELNGREQIEKIAKKQNNYFKLSTVGFILLFLSFFI